MIDVRATGIGKFKRRNIVITKERLRRIKNANQITSLELETESKKRLQAQLEINNEGNGRLLNGIIGEHSGQFAMVYNRVFYAPYVEFGTGAYASEYLKDKDKDMRDYAYNFYVNGKGTMPAKPSMFPSAYAIKPKHIARLEKAVNG